MSQKPSVEFVGNVVLIHLPKALLLLTRAQFVEALKQGKAWRRREQRAKRIATITPKE